MNVMSLLNRANLEVVERYYQNWKADPGSVDESWQMFFHGFELGFGRPYQPSADSSKQIGIFRLIESYRELGHRLARIDPLSEPPKTLPLLELSQFGLEESDLNQTFDTRPFLGLERGTLRSLIAALRETYCRTIGVEYMHIQDMRVREWLQERMEPTRNKANFPRRKRFRILLSLYYSEMFERFLHSSYVGQKRFSLEGADTLIPILDALATKAADSGVREIVLGMAHRGRLNVLANILGKPLRDVFGEFEDNYLLDSFAGDGDVKYHLGFSSDYQTPQNNRVHLSLTPNPSHLEAVNPVVEGRTRAKQQWFNDVERKLGIPVLIHGDAAFAGQGLVAETLNLSQLPGFRTGGTIHVIINNMIGFTTTPEEARSTLYCSDVAKMIEAPIFHVNAEDPDAAVLVTELALDFRQTFHRDVVIDMVCYRKHGHNEMDEPAYTQPLMYSKIKEHPSLQEVYTEHLIITGDLTTEEAEGLRQGFQEKLQTAKEELAGNGQVPFGMRGWTGRWKGLRPNYSHVPVETGVPQATLQKVGAGMTTVPPDFAVHPKLLKMVEARRTAILEDKPIDWSTAEALAFGSLLLEGTSVRFSGQDSQRGTFSQRHAVLTDVNTGKDYLPLANLDPGQAPFFIYDSLLSEMAVLGFEYGYSLDSPDSLVLWEAQFGDFGNGAQVIIDQFIASSRSKWQRDSGLVMLLPHGYEGQGPEHSSGRLERFLQLSAEDNIQVCNLSTPAQYFHVLRRQIHRNFRRPLILMTPKSLLRNKNCVSRLAEFASGTFLEVIDDEQAKPKEVRRVVLCSGKIYYDLMEQRQRADASTAIIRVEQFAPFPRELMERVLGRYSTWAEEYLWVQEESQNMGAWTYIEPRLREMGYSVQYIGRDASASPATGSYRIHLREQEEIIKLALHSKKAKLQKK